MKSIVLIAIGALIGLAAILGIWQIAERNYTYQESLIDPPAEAADFELVAQDGQPFRLSDQHGKVVLIFFGYTNCPDVCPVTLSDFRRVKQQLGDQGEHVRFVYITVDPERDDVEQVRTYMSLFDPSFIGLTGTLAELEPVWRDYGVYQFKQEEESVDHSSRIYVVDRKGNLRLTYLFGTDLEVLLEDIQHLLREK